MAAGDVTNGGALTEPVYTATDDTQVGVGPGAYMSTNVFLRRSGIWGPVVRGSTTPTQQQADVLFWQPNGTANRRIAQIVLGGSMMILRGLTDALAQAGVISIDLANTNVGIGTAAPNASAELDVSGTKSLLIPRLTTTQRNALTATDGMMIYNTTSSLFEVREAGAWRTM